MYLFNYLLMLILFYPCIVTQDIHNCTMQNLQNIEQQCLSNPEHTSDLSEMHPIIKGEKLKNTPTQLIKINTADIKILQTMPGIGPKRAQAIYNYRNQLPDKKFHSLKQLLEIKGINQKILNRISPYFIL